MKVSVGSTNPTKVNAVKAVMFCIYDDFTVIPIKVDSGVPPMPLTETETVTGAVNRAFRALEADPGDIGVGMEGGLVRKRDAYFLAGWCAVVGTDGDVRLGCGIYLPLPDAVVECVRRGTELGEVIDRLVGEVDTKKRSGAVGFLTGGLIPRQTVWEIGLTYAMASRITPELHGAIARKKLK